jgi:hypothetical protein
MSRHRNAAQICAPDRVTAATGARIVGCGRNAFERAVRMGRIVLKLDEDGRRSMTLSDVLKFKSRK